MAGRNLSPTSTTSAHSIATPQLGTQTTSRASSTSTASALMSTPPTSLGDEASVLSDAIKMDQPVETTEVAPPSPLVADAVATPHATPQATPTPMPDANGSVGSKRSMRISRAAPPTYNVQILAGTAIHTPTKYLPKHHKNVLHGPIEEALPKNSRPDTGPSPRRRKSTSAIKTDPDEVNDPAEEQLACEAAQAAQRRKSTRNTNTTDLRREAIRNVTANLTTTAQAIADKTSELFGVKSKGSRATADTASARGSKAPVTPTEEEASELEEEKVYVRPKVKQWERQGLYVGQHREFDPRLKESKNRIRRQSKKVKEKEILPLPMFAGERMLNGTYRRDFKLPFDVYHPLPRKVKVDGWVKLQKNRFIGEASALWKREKQDSSQCYCQPEDGCGETCHNRIMAYECDDTNCKLTPEQCNNRPFAELKKRAKGNGYDYGVEVMETGDKGYGVRAMRTFEPHQIIVEYAGEIITQSECERRMKQIYKKDKCYYLMSFDNKMIIDATRGTIARFVNHSCEPNCEMIKWTVGGEPRMALFAGSRGIMSGDELTYDYNFDPFSSKNIQVCRCGTRNCRGVLGPKPKHQPQPREEKSMVSTVYAGAKRKLQDVFGSGSGSNKAQHSPKKRKYSSFMANAAQTKAQNAMAEEAAAREKAARDAEELKAQKASRLDRALKRTTSTTTLNVSEETEEIEETEETEITVAQPEEKSSSSSRKSLPAFTKTTTKKTYNVVNKRLIRKSQPLPTPVSKRIGSSKASSSKAPVHDTPEPEEEDLTPNITPASLRSATRKNLVQKSQSQSSLTQTKLLFKPLNLGFSSKAKSASEKTKEKDVFAVPDSDDEDVEMEDAAPASKRTKKATAATTKTGRLSSAKKAPVKSVRGKRASAGGRSSLGNSRKRVCDESDDDVWEVDDD